METPAMRMLLAALLFTCAAAQAQTEKWDKDIGKRDSSHRP